MDRSGNPASTIYIHRPESTWVCSDIGIHHLSARRDHMHVPSGDECLDELVFATTVAEVVSKDP